MVRESNPFGARFSLPVLTSSGAHPASGTMGTGNRPGRGLGHPPQSSSEVKERVALYLYFPSGSSCLVLGRTLLYLNNREGTRTSNWYIFFTEGGVYLDDEIVTSTKLL